LESPTCAVTLPLPEQFHVFFSTLYQRGQLDPLYVHSFIHPNKSAASPLVKFFEIDGGELEKRTKSTLKNTHCPLAHTDASTSALASASNSFQGFLSRLTGS